MLKKQRNILHNHPMLMKGGVHDTTTKAKRKKEKQKLRKEWYSLVAFLKVLVDNIFHENIYFDFNTN